MPASAGQVLVSVLQQASMAEQQYSGFGRLPGRVDWWGSNFPCPCTSRGSRRCRSTRYGRANRAAAPGYSRQDRRWRAHRGRRTSHRPVSGYRGTGPVSGLGAGGGPHRRPFEAQPRSQWQRHQGQGGPSAPSAGRAQSRTSLFVGRLETLLFGISEAGKRPDSRRLRRPAAATGGELRYRARMRHCFRHRFATKWHRSYPTARAWSSRVPAMSWISSQGTR